MASLSGNKIKDTYQSLIKLTDNGNLTTGAKQLTDGFGNNSPLYISTTQIGIGVTPEATFDLHVYQNAKVGGNLTITGDLTVNGTTTTVGTDTLSVKDPLIVLANNNTSADSVDIGFYGKYAPSGTTLYAGLFRDTGDNKFKLFRDLEEEPTTTVNTSGTGYTKAGLVIGGLEATTGSFADDITLAATKRLKYADEKIIIGNTNSTLGNQAISLGYDADSTGNQSIGIGYNPEASGTYSVAIGYNVTASGTGTFVFGTSGSHSDDNTLVASGLDLKVTGTGQSSFAGQVTIPATPSASTDAASKGYVDSQVGANNELSEVLANGNTTGGTDISVSSGDDITFADSSKSIYGAGSDLQIYSDGSYNYIHCTSNELRIRSNTLRLLNSAGTANYITADNLQAVQLYYNNSKKFETTSTGVTVTGAVSATTFSGQLDGTISSATTATTQSDGDNSTKVATTAYVDTAIQGHDTLAEVLVGGNTTGATKIEVNNTSSGIDFIDNAKARFGTDDDLEIYHNGTNAVIDNGTNNIVFNVAGKTIINSSSTDNELNLGHSSGNWFAKATNSNTLIIGSESNATNNITLDTTNGGSATFSGDVTVTGGDLTLGTDSIASNINAVGDVLGINVDSNTGGGAGANIQLKTAGTTQLTINSSSATFAGRVGINQTSPSSFFANASQLVIGDGSTSRGMTIYGSSAGDSQIFFADGVTGDQQYRGIFRYEHSSDAMVMFTSATERMRIDSSGTVSIGSSATSTDRRFQVTGTNTDLSATTTQFGIVNNPTYPNTITSNIYNLYTGPNVTSGATLTNLYNLYLEANNYSGSTVTNSYGLYQAGTSDKNYFAGNVGIGVTSPLGSSKLHVSSANGTAYTSNAQLRVSGGATNNNRATILFSDDALSDGKLSYYPASGTSAYFSLSARGTEADFIVKADGNVGIGLTSPAAKLEVYGNVQNNTTSIANSAAYIRGADVGIAIGQSASSPYGTWVQSQRNSDGVTFPLSLNPSGGNVGIGTTSPNAKLEIGSGQAKTVTSGVEWARFGTSNEASNYATLTCEVKGGATAADRKWIFQTIESGVANAGNIIFQPSGGNVGIGTDSPRNDANFVTLQVGNTTTGGSQIVLDDNDTNGPWRIISNQSLIINDDATERMRIDSSGNIKTGDNIKIMGTTFGDSFLSFSSNGNTVLKANDDVVIGYSSSLYVKQGGNVGIGTSLPGYMLHVQSNSSSTSAAFFRPNVIGSGDPAEPTTVFIDGQKAAALDINRFYSHGTIVNIRQNNSNVGSISVTGVATSYNTSSDYRLKENVVEMTDALDRVSQLKPSRFNFIGHEEIVDGFLAHEVSDIVPEAITGTKDEVDAEGNPVYQGIDQSKLVPLLVGAIQELQKRIEILENK